MTNLKRLCQEKSKFSFERTTVTTPALFETQIPTNFAKNRLLSVVILIIEGERLNFL